jgi:hypothetical protein
MTGEPTKLWSALSLEGSVSVVPSLSDPCLSCALFTRLTQIGAGGWWTMPDLMTSRDSGSCRLRSPNLSAMKRRDPRTHLEPKRNLVDWNAIDLT